MDDTRTEITKKYSKDSVYAIPVAYVLYAMFFSKAQLKESTSRKEIISLTSSIALANNIGTIITLLKIYKLQLVKKGFKKQNYIIL